MLDLFVACAPGLEPLLARELTDLGLAEVRSEPGGASVRAKPRAVAAICLGSGLANHLRLRVGAPFQVRHFDKLLKKTAALPWGDLLRPGTRVKAHAVCRKSRLYHSGGVAQRVEAGIAKVIGAPADGTPEVDVAVRIFAIGARSHSTSAVKPCTAEAGASRPPRPRCVKTWLEHC